jgi:hypothetical protein
MPAEETGNMLLMIAALAKVQGHAGFAEHYWDQLSRWAAYLRDKGLDLENQLSTDDFAGHLAHNTNLSIKAISALDAYAELARTLARPLLPTSITHRRSRWRPDGRRWPRTATTRGWRSTSRVRGARTTIWSGTR